LKTQNVFCFGFYFCSPFLILTFGFLLTQNFFGKIVFFKHFKKAQLG
jgi:hypothetical protein